MKEIKMLYRDNLPCWYELSWQKAKPTIKLQAHKDFIKNTEVVREDAPIVAGFKANFGFSNFVGSFDGNFGFDNAFIHNKETDEFVEFIIKIPEIKKDTGKSCSRCNGSGKEEDSKCLWCGGTGKEYILNWETAYAVSASFTVFFLLSRLPEKETSSALLQLMTISTATGKGSSGCGVAGEFSVPLCNWMDSLRENGNPTISEMIEAMQLSHKAMFGHLSEYEKYDFRASVDYEGGWLNTSCPGDACGLNPVHMGPKKGMGYEFTDHNVDTPSQQIELIASLAALHDKARKEIQFA